MKTVLLLRHGKSDWASDTGNDRDRPLAKRGRRAAKVMGQRLARSGLVPDAAVTSPAVRAHTTLELAMKAGGWNCPVQVSEALYGEGAFAVMEEIGRQSDASATLLLVGHEPTWSETLALLVGGGRHRVPTGALVGIDLDVDAWADVGPGAGQLAFLLPPRLLADE
ncbi:MAG: histidine phosphatase family protein [Actinomycetota bacterium]|nr:histidine phosphatase family protein [Actinomycetota bacterium]